MDRHKRTATNGHASRVSHAGKVTKPTTSRQAVLSEPTAPQLARVNESTVTLSAVITLTTDLGETFYPHDIQLAATLRRSDEKPATATQAVNQKSDSRAIGASESTNSITSRDDAPPPALPGQTPRKVAAYHYPAARIEQPYLTKTPPPYIPKPKTTEPTRQGPHTTQAIYSDHRKELEAIATEHSVNWRHVEYFLWTKGYVGGFRPARILQFTLNRIKETRTHGQLTNEQLTDIDKELLSTDRDLIDNINEMATTSTLSSNTLNQRNDIIPDREEDEEFFEVDEGTTDGIVDQDSTSGP